MADDFLMDEIKGNRSFRNSDSNNRSSNSNRLRILRNVIIPTIGRCSSDSSSAQDLLVTLTDALSEHDQNKTVGSTLATL